MGELTAYLESLPSPQREALQQVVDVARRAAPEAEEGRSYGMPALRYNKRPLLGFVAAKGHLSVFPFSSAVIDGLRDRLDGFDASKGTIRFSVTHPIPDDVLSEIVRARVDEIT